MNKNVKKRKLFLNTLTQFVSLTTTLSNVHNISPHTQSYSHTHTHPDSHTILFSSSYSLYTLSISLSLTHTLSFSYTLYLLHSLLLLPSLSFTIIFFHAQTLVLSNTHYFTLSLLLSVSHTPLPLYHIISISLSL